MDQYDIVSRNVRIFGRNLEIAGALWLGYSGSGIEFWTEAENVKCDILGVSTTNDPATFSWLGVFLDDEDTMYRKLMIRRDLHSYDILRNPEKRRVKVTIVKLTENRYDKLALSVLHADAPVIPTEEKERKILFIGDSIMAGYGVLGEHGLSDDPGAYRFTTEEEDVTAAYAWRAAAALGAQGQYFCQSGNGVISQYVDPSSEVPVTENLMPAQWPYVDRETESTARIYLAAHGWKDPKRGQGPALYRPQDFRADVVVSDLGTNDASFTRQIPVREQHFVQRYLEFLRQVQRDCPGAKILIVCGIMDRTLCEACHQTAVLGDFAWLEMPQMDPLADGIGGAGHPSQSTHRLEAEVLVSKIRTMTGWREEELQ